MTFFGFPEDALNVYYKAQELGLQAEMGVTSRDGHASVSALADVDYGGLRLDQALVRIQELTDEAQRLGFSLG